ncbi:DUF7521 family protein [Natrinema halophilum]|uniref:DUF7521 family protein n=1 Tax=Natrinema halophilum TaxID=1699371 RepID=UPI001F2E73C4|nr:hypothetical protein [Natrinema halophilum]QLG51237.2 hypothetical protein HYG82_14500 [Natrinema halophilum]
MSASIVSAIAPVLEGPRAVVFLLETTVVGLDEATTIFFLGLASAVLGTVVTWTAYRGFVRNDSQPMLFLAIGVAFLTVVPFVLSHAVELTTDAADATVLLVVTACHLLGLIAIVRSFRRPNSG